MNLLITALGEIMKTATIGSWLLKPYNALDGLSIVRSFIVAFRSAKEWENATFAERKATLVFRTMLKPIEVIDLKWIRDAIGPKRIPKRIHLRLDFSCDH